MTKTTTIQPWERCMARSGFYSTPCGNRALPGMCFCGVHKAQEGPHRENMKAIQLMKAMRRRKAEAK